MKNGIKLRKFDGVDGKTHVGFDDATGTELIRASPDGITIKNYLVKTRPELEFLAELVGKAWAEHIKLAPKITKTLSGH